MSEQTLTALIGILPQVVLIVLLLVIVLALRRPLFEQVLPRISSVKVVGLQVDLQPREVQALVSQQAPAERDQPTIEAIDSVGRRAARNAEALKGRVALWVDDHPEWTRAERLVLHRLGIYAEPVRSTEEARRELGAAHAHTYDLVISDLSRDDATDEAMEIIELAKRAPGSPHVIFYVGSARPDIPPGAFGITSRPDELWHLVMDVLERHTPIMPAPSRGL